MTPLVVDRPRDVGDLLGTVLQVFWARAGLFFALALPVVAPVTILVDGVWGGTFADGLDADPVPAAVATSAFLDTLVVVPLITVLHVRVVQALGQGEEPTVGWALRAASGAFLPAVAVLAMYMAVVILGMVALIVPGIWLLVRFYFGAQAVVIEGRRGRDALARSAELVKGHWWRVLGIVLLLGIVTSIVASLAGLLLGLPGLVLDSGFALVIGVTFATAIAYSLGAIGGALLFFDLRARREERFGGFAAPVPGGIEP